MTLLEELEKSSQLDQHLAAHEYAERFYIHVEQLLHQGCEPEQMRLAVSELYRRARENGEVVKRDGLVEVLDALDAEYPSQTDQSGRFPAA